MKTLLKIFIMAMFFCIFSNTSINLTTQKLNKNELFDLKNTYNHEISCIRCMNNHFLITTNTASAKEIEDSSEQKTVNSEMELYTEFQKEQGSWNKFGQLMYLDSTTHSQLLLIRPGTKYFVGYKDVKNKTRAVFFDKNGKFLRSLMTKDLVEYSYKKPDATGKFKNYVKIYTFSSPNNAHYISLNLTVDPSYNYREYISSKPVFALTGTGNIIIHENDEVYQKNNKRKLCVFGSSQVMTDRLLRTGNFNEYGENVSHYVVGIPEYLLPWWHTCHVYGYSNASMMPLDDAKTPSIYERVVKNKLDLSLYDDFLITLSGIGIKANNIGYLTDSTDLGNNKTFIGALRQIIAYIYTQNPKAKIYIQTRLIRSSYSNAAQLAAIQQTNEKIREMCNMLGLICVDCERYSGFNQSVASKWCYDKLGHYNHFGSKMMGLSIRKIMLGF